MGRADTTSRGTYRPHGVADAFQVMCHMVEPSHSVTVCNLLAKDRDSALLAEASADELEPGRPEVALVIEPATRARGAEGLAGARARPDRPLVGPAGEPEGVGPDPDAGEEVALGVSPELGGSNIDN